nr:immunoglobulin light chain junction region [Macaca mulatta]MOW28198.1 immunoglobulin light chain junction region [Macaca mulatta]MOW28470.1 immunoglobulin light chain junction region [Macaca mulatta]MOW28621.1 immunoglobulin light chain junction region [Macaca mulatta]MOW28734.1 immunoglobulin light chain junction region [Macaca mulatta]
DYHCSSYVGSKSSWVF